MTMKVYTGDRTIDGIVVTVDGEPLDPRTDIQEFTVNGFEWTYEGAGIPAACPGHPRRPPGRRSARASPQ